MTEAEWQEQMRIAQDTVNALIKERDEALSTEKNKVANLLAQLLAMQRRIEARDATIAEKDARIKTLETQSAQSTAEPPPPKPNGIMAPAPEMQAPAPAPA